MNTWVISEDGDSVAATPIVQRCTRCEWLALAKVLPSDPFLGANRIVGGTERA